MTILITTAGKVGQEAARLLAGHQQGVRILARSEEKIAALRELDADVVHADLESPGAVDAAMHGITSVVLVTAPVVSQELNVIRAAVKAGVGHVVKITAKSSADSPIRRRRDQAAIEEQLIGSGLHYTLLKNNAYMQNFLMLAPSISQTNSFSSATGNGRVGHVDARDVAAVAAEIAAHPAEHVGKTYWPTGPQVLSGADAAAVFTTVLGHEITFRPLSFDEQKQAMLAAGVPEAVADDNARAVGLMADGDCDYVTDDVPALLGRPAQTFENFVTTYRSAFTTS